MLCYTAGCRDSNSAISKSCDRRERIRELPLHVVHLAAAAAVVVVIVVAAAAAKDDDKENYPAAVVVAKSIVTHNRFLLKITFRQAFLFCSLEVVTLHNTSVQKIGYTLWKNYA